MSRYVGIIIGSALIATGIGAALGVPMFTVAFTTFAMAHAGTLIALGASTILSGIGTLLTQGPLKGLSTAARNSIAAWVVTYGRSRPGGTIVYMQETGDDNRYLQLVIVVACHPCQSIDALLFDNQRVCLSLSGDSLHPSQQTVSIASITRAGDVVTVVMSAPLPLPASDAVGPAMLDGDRLRIHDVSADESLNGTYPISVINATTCTYICGGPAVTITGDGHVTTVWPDYSTTVHMETLLGNQTSTFPGLLATDSTGSQGLWTDQHLLLGKTAVYLRLRYHDNIYSSGLPSIAFLVHGKCDLYDPRNGIILARPTVYLNGWGHNAHEGPYELGEDQATNWVLNDDTTYPYFYPERACDSDLGSAAVITMRHTHKYAGCIYKFAALPSTPSDLYLSVYSSIPSVGSGQLRSSGVWYSLDGGTTWTMLYNEATKPLEWNSVHLSTSQDCSLIQVMIFMDSHDDMSHSVYDIQLATGPGSSGYSENAAICIADYLSNNIWGFKATYGTEIPYPELIAAAKICDEDVPLAAGGTEKRYQCNGEFPLSMKRGEVLQNLLTSCGGRLTYSGGEFVIHPAGWPGVSLAIGDKPITSATVYVISANFPAVSSGVTGLSNITVGPTAVGGGIHTIVNASNYARRTDSSALTSGELAGGLDTVEIWCRNFQTLSLNTDPSDPSKVLLYDCWLVATHPDSSTTTYKPVATRVENPSTGYGSVEDPELAEDPDDTTYATINRWHYAPLADHNVVTLVLSGFVPAGGASGPPDTSIAGITASALALSQAAGPFRWKSKVSSRDLYNGVKGTYVSPGNAWQSSDIPAYAQDQKHGYATDVNLAADGGDRRWLDIQLPFTISPACAQRLAKIELLRRRQQGTGTFAFNMALYKATALDIVAFTLPLLGWNGKLLEVAAHRFTIQKGEGEGDSAGTMLGTELDVQETDPSVYEWDPSEELTPQGFQQPTLPDMSTVAPPTAVSAISGSSTSVTGADGISRSRILTTWTPPADGYVTNGGHIEVQYQSASCGGGGTGSSDALTRIANDMGVNEGHPHGVPPTYDFYSGSFIGMGNDPAGNAAIEFWGDLYIDAGGNPATNTLVNIRNCQIWWKRASTGAWTLGVLTNTVEIGRYAEDFSSFIALLTPRTETDGSLSFKTVSGEVAHFYAPFPRIPIDPADMGGIVSVCEARLIVDNSGLADDRSSAKFLLGAGGDYYPATTGPGITGNPGIGGGKFKYVTSDWNSFAFTTLSLTELSTDPTPPIDLSGSGGGTGGSGGSTWIGVPSVDPSVTQVYIDGVTDGQTYNVRVRSVNAAGSSSDWVSAAPVTVSGTASVIPPATISGDGASSGDVLVWDGTAWVPTTPTGGGGTAVREIPTGTMNGTNTVFTLSSAPDPASSLLLFLNGIEQLPGTDYTLSGATITYTVAPSATDWHMAWYGTVGGGVTTGELVIGFVIVSGSTGTNVGPMLAAPHAGSLTKCTVTTKASDGATALTFRIRQNGTSVFSTLPTVAAGTGSGTVSTFTALTSNPLPATEGDVFSIDITSGTSSWQFTAQLE